MTYSTLLYSVDARIATVTVNRPDKLNALNAKVIRELGAVATRIAQDPEVRGVILTGAGEKAFVAGADIAELSELAPAAARATAEEGQQAFERLEQGRKPVVAAINGFALGGGLELAMACHIRIAAEHAKFGQPEVKLGLCPGYGGTVRLPRLVGRGRAVELLLSGGMIDAAEAYRIGLVNQVVPQAELLSTTRGLLETILANAPLALAACLESVHTGLDLAQADALSHEAEQFGALFGTADMQEGTAAFLARRKADFRGA
ncbi:MAG TPA: enoyl-CoA hydratase-related protein [Gemmatimonadales bacterium]|nr:enoyl-CoA hydratase-related protein [Gemmatimonadales bacterium]